MADWIKKPRILNMLPTKDSLQARRHTETKSRGIKNISHKRKGQKTGSKIHITKIDFKTKAITKDKEGHYIIIKGSIQEEDITLINIHTQYRST